MLFGLLGAPYFVDLANTPVYFGGDEAHFAVGGHAIATTGRNLSGELLPVFVNLADPLGGKSQAWGDTWYQPFLFYLVAIVLKVLPFTEAVIRLPMAVVGGMLTPMVMFLMTWRLFGSGPAAMAATLVVALAPTHVVLSRQALDYVLPIPFVICWLWSLALYLDSKKTKYIVMAGAFLGVGCYSYIASWAMMPLYLLMTWVVLLRAGLGMRPIVLSAIAFAVPVGIGALWILAHPEMLAQTATRYEANEGPRHGFFETYLSMLKPLVLFVRGGPSPTTSTARSGFVLLPFALLMLAGLWQLARRRDWIAAVILAGLITAPIPAAFKGEPGMIQRAMYLLPFLGLLGGLGYYALWHSPKVVFRAAAVLTIVLAPVQFGYFYYDYFGHYKLRSAFYYDPVAFHLIPDRLLREAPAPAYYFTTDVDDASVKWRYYLIKAGRQELLARTTYVEPNARPDAAPGSVLVTYPDNNRIAALAAAGWRVQMWISDVDNRIAAAVLRKRR
jgi:hypothetical protein